MIEFHHQKELEDFVNPVLKFRVKELATMEIKTSKKELFNYLKEKKWKYQKNLHLYEVVDDILNYKIEKREIDSK